MSATRAPIQSLDQAIERIEALEDLLQQGFEYLTPSVYSINAKGEIEAKITGILEAAGINFQEGTAAGLTTSEIRWLFGAIAETIIGAYRIGEVHHLGIFTQPTGADFAQLSLTAGPTLSKAVFGATSESSPCLIELSMNAEGKPEATLRAGATEINLLEPGTTYTGEGAIEITAGHVIKIKAKSIENGMLNGVCIFLGGPQNNVNVTEGSIIEGYLAKECVKGGAGGAVFTESITGGEGGNVSRETLTTYNIAEKTIRGLNIASNTLTGENAKEPQAPAHLAKEGEATAFAGTVTGIAQSQRFGITGNGMQTTWKCKHKLGTVGTGTKFVHPGGAWKTNAGEEPIESFSPGQKVVIVSNTEVEIIFEGAPAKGEKVIFDLLSA